jgi:predicted transcriptional regulator
MSTRESLHKLIDVLSEEDADALLEHALASFGEPEPLSEDDIASIRRGLEDAEAGRLITTEELLRRLSRA